MDLTPPPPAKNPGWRRWWAPPRWARPRWPWPWRPSLGRRDRQRRLPPGLPGAGHRHRQAQPEERARVPHHLIDVADPPEPYDAARYCREGREVLDDLSRRGVPPLVVGGTGLYLKALLVGPLCRGRTGPGGQGPGAPGVGGPGAARPLCAPHPPGPGHRRPAPPPRHLPDHPGPGGDGGHRPAPVGVHRGPPLSGRAL